MRNPSDTKGSDPFNSVLPYGTCTLNANPRLYDTYKRIVSALHCGRLLYTNGSVIVLKRKECYLVVYRNALGCASCEREAAGTFRWRGQELISMRELEGEGTGIV